MRAGAAVLVQSDVELLRLGIERASGRVGLRITDQESHAALIVRDAHVPLEDLRSHPVLEVEGGVVHLTTSSALEPDLWASIGRLANEVLGRAVI